MIGDPLLKVLKTSGVPDLRCAASGMTHFGIGIHACHFVKQLEL